MNRDLAIQIAWKVLELKKLCNAAKNHGTELLIDVTPDLGNPAIDKPAVYVEPLSELMSIVPDGEEVTIEPLGGAGKDYPHRLFYVLHGVEFHAVCSDQDLLNNGLEVPNG